MIKKMKIILSTWLILFGIVSNLHAQSDLSFYHLGELTPQSNIYNPVFFPDADFYVSLPVLSGVNTNWNNSFSYNDVFESIEGSDSVQFAPEKLLANMKNGDRMSFNASVSLLQIGFHVGNGAVQLFANERAKSSLFYPKHLLEYVLHGNGDFLEEEIEETNLRVKGTYYREYGVGYSHQLNVLGNKKLRVGLKVKYLQGIARAHADEDAKISLLTDASSMVHIRTNQPVVYTAGFDSMEDADYFISNNNTGYGFDIGADLQITPKLTVAVAVNDIGSITWKEGVKNYQLNESEAVFGGLDLKDIDNLSDILSDTLEQLFDYEEISDVSFSSKLNTRIFASGTYQVIPKGTVTATVMTRNDLGKQSFTYGVGYTHRFGKMLTASTTVSKKPHQGFVIGGGFGARLGFIQLYTSVDNVIGFTDVRKMQSVNVRVGMNFLFGHRSMKKADKKEKTTESSIPTLEKSKKEKETISPFPEEYDLDHLEDLGNN